MMLTRNIALITERDGKPNDKANIKIPRIKA